MNSKLLKKSSLKFTMSNTNIKGGCGVHVKSALEVQHVCLVNSCSFFLAMDIFYNFPLHTAYIFWSAIMNYNTPFMMLKVVTVKCREEHGHLIQIKFEAKGTF